MKMNCNLELRLVPPSPFIVSDHHHLHDHHDRQENSSEEVNGLGEDLKEKQNQQQLTIFYDRKVIVCDVTELQATTIIKLANEEMKEKRRTPGSTTSLEPSSLSMSPLLCNQSGISMKRSLQRFLQKRKNRIGATSPYHH